MAMLLDECYVVDDIDDVASVLSFRILSRHLGMTVARSLCRNVVLKNLGLVSYTSALTTMHHLRDNKLNKGVKENYLITCQHHPVYTLGTRKDVSYMSQEMLQNLESIGAELIKTNRGGLITFHGPGQLVCYPVINLKDFSLSVRCYVHKLEQLLINLCNDFGLEAHRTDDVGIWLGNSKIAALGIHCKRYVTTHGIALNCNNDLSWFDQIVPCGLHGKGVTSLSEELKRDVKVEGVLEVFIRHFEDVFDATAVEEPSV